MTLPKHLVILSPGFPASEADTTCLPAQQSLVRALNAQFPGISVTVIAFQYPYSQAEYNWHGNRVIPLGGRNRKRWHRLRTWWRCWRELKALHKQHEISGLLSFWLDECAFIGHRFSRRSGIRHKTWLLGQDARAGNRYVKWMRPQASSLVAISDYLAEQLHANYGIRPAHVITNGIDPSEFGGQPAHKDIDLIGAGSLIPLKRFDRFIDVVKSISKERPTVKAVICGKGPEEGNLRRKITEQQLENNIELVGELDHAALLGMMQRSRILLHPSSYEGFSGACLEALYAGAHVISFFSPQDAWIRHWHIVPDEQAMATLALEQLRANEADFYPVLPYSISDSASQFVRLFSNK